MPTPYPDPFSGLATGLQQGMQMGLLGRERNLAEQKALDEKKTQAEQQKFEKGLKLLELGATYSKIKNPAYREKGLLFTKQGAEILGMPMPEQMPPWQDEFGDVANEIDSAIKGYRQFGDKDVLEKALRMSYGKAGSILDENQLKNLREDTGKQVEGIAKGQESGMLAQAAQMPSLVQQGVLSPEQGQEGKLAALAAGGTKGQEILAKGMEAGNKPEPKQWQVFYDKNNKPLTIDMKNDADVARIQKEGLTPVSIVSGEKRAAAYASNRYYQVLDGVQGNRPRWVKGNEIDNNPNRYTASAEGAKALNKTALIEDIRGNIIATRTAIQNPNLTFDTDTQAKIARLLTDRDPGSAISAFLDSKIGASLTSEQQDYLVKTQQLIENAMAMRSVLGAGQGSEDLRNAIKRTIPGQSTPSKEFALKQLLATEQTLNRLSRGIPEVSLRNENMIGTQAEPTGHKFDKFLK